MALSHSPAIRDQNVDNAVDAIDVGTTNPEGVLRFLEGVTSRCEVTPQNPAFSGSASQVASLLGVPLDSSLATATAVALDAFDWQDRDRNFCWGGTITGTGGGGDIEMADPTLADNDIIRVTSFDYNAHA